VIKGSDKKEPDWLNKRSQEEFLRGYYQRKTGKIHIALEVSQQIICITLLKIGGQPE
jgi:hypothetical protein